MTLTQLSYIVAVAEHRSFNLAASHCGVTQPTLSIQIRKLEEELGVQIFDRSRHPVEPTDIGHLMIDQARVVLRESERLRGLVDEVGGEVRGELRIGVIPTLAPYLLPRLLGDLSLRHPALTLVVEEVVTERVIDLLKTDRIDAGLLATPVDERGLVERPLFEEPFVGYLSEDHELFCEPALSADALDAADIWLLREGHCFRDQVLVLCREASPADGAPRPYRFESGNLETLKRLVESKGGMTLLPALAVTDLRPEERVRLRPFTSPSPFRQIRLVQGQGYLKRHLIEAFVDSVLDALPGDCRLVPAG